jgi:hypothetical protein
MKLSFISVIVLFFCLVITIGLMRATWNMPFPEKHPYYVSIIWILAITGLFYISITFVNTLMYAYKDPESDFISLIACIIFTIIIIIASIVWGVKTGKEYNKFLELNPSFLN